MIDKNMKITVAGSGTMGTQIAMQVALNGYSVKLYDMSEKALAKANAFANEWCDKKIAKGKMNENEKEEFLSRLMFTDDIKLAAEAADIVIEAIIDVVSAKRAFLKEIDQYTPENAIYASNSSYIVSSRFADAVEHPENVLNTHFFNPALVMKLVEIVKGDHVSDKVIDTMFEFISSIGKEPVLIKKEIYGFVVNRIFSAMTKEACYLVDMGIASVEDIDKAVKLGLGHSMGPLEILDMTGIDLEYDVLMDKFRMTGDPADRPSAALVERYAKGEYGRKSKKGFYDYE